MKRIVELIGGVLALAGLASCQPSIYSVTQETAYSPSEYRYAAGGKKLHAVIRGNPFPYPDQQIHQQVVSIMQQVNLSFDTALVRGTSFSLGSGTRPRVSSGGAFQP